MTLTERSTFAVASGGSMAEAIGGVAVLVLAILALAGVSPRFLEAIAVIVLGIAVLSQGATLYAEFSSILLRPADPALRITGFGAGWSVAPVAGIAGIVLGVLALIGISDTVLMASAIIILGSALALTAGAVGQLGLARATLLGGDERAQRAATGLLSSSVIAQAAAGLAAVILGILALAGVNPTAVTLVALLELGVFVALAGTTFELFQAPRAV